MVFNLNTTKNLPQSSTSSCTDYFFDGCQSKSQNNCHNQYQNCQCRPCCVNSMINDHTYSLLKKICRKVIRDYHRQKSREKYTIFDGGNSINVRIQRSSVGEGGICQHLNGDSSFSTIGKTGRRDVTHGKDVKESKYEDRREGRKDGSISDKSGKGVGSKKHGEKEKLRKSQYDVSDTKRAKKKRSKEQEYDDGDRGKNGKGRKGKDVDEQSVNGKGRKGKRGKGVEDEDDFNGMGKKDKGSKYKSPRQGGNGDDETSARKNGRGKMTTDAGKGRSSKSGKEGHGRKQKGLTGDGDEEDGDSFDAKMGKKKSEKDKRVRGSRDEDHTFLKTKLDKSKNKELEDNEESGTANEGKRKQRNDQKNRAIGSAGTKKYDGKKRFRDDNSTEDLNYEEMGHKKGRFGSARGDRDGDRDGKDSESKGKPSREKRIINRDQELKDYQNGNGKDFADGDRKRPSHKKKDISDLPIISDLRTKVRKGHVVIPVRKSSNSKNIYRSRSIQDERLKKRGSKPGKKQYSKGIKDEINERRGARRRRKNRSSRGFGGRFGTHRVYRTGVTSRCDEIRPCDILRAHMEQRELCERRRCCCMPCSCDCSAVYCRDPSTICSRIC